MECNSYGECDCCRCNRKEYIRRGAYRRLPKEIRGLGLCPNLKFENVIDSTKKRWPIRGNEEKGRV